MIFRFFDNLSIAHVLADSAYYHHTRTFDPETYTTDSCALLCITLTGPALPHATSRCARDAVVPSARSMSTNSIVAKLPDRENRLGRLKMVG